MNVQSVLEWVRQPEYTGENRCMPCTIVNLCITAIVSAVLWLLWRPVAIAFALLSFVSIGLRGYLVPGTPTLTKRYFPDRVLALFDKEPVPTFENQHLDFETETTAQTDIEIETDTDTEIETDTETDTDIENSEPLDTERILLESGILELCADIDDLCLASDFREEWNEHMDTIIESDAERETLAEALKHDGEDDIEFQEYGDAFAAHIDGQSVGQWESHAAFVADLAAARELPNWIEEWDSLESPEQGTLIRGLRVFAEKCPICDGMVVPSQETRESCCREHTVVAIACESCDARLFETTAEPDAMHP